MILFAAQAIVTCPDATNANAQNPLNPLSGSMSSQITFNRPEISNFPNNNNVQMQYSVNNQVVATIPYTTQTHTLTNLQVGQNFIVVTASDGAGNSAICFFTYVRTGMYNPNPSLLSKLFTCSLSDFNRHFKKARFLWNRTRDPSPPISCPPMATPVT